jgi:hypothetical protein
MRTYAHDHVIHSVHTRVRGNPITDIIGYIAFDEDGAYPILEDVYMSTDSPGYDRLYVHHMPAE